RNLVGAVLLLTVVASAPALFAAPRQAKVLVGIMPVYDMSGESFGDVFARNLTFILYRELQGSGSVEPVLLMPGGVYTPAADDWIQDYARNANVDAVLVTQFDSDRNRRGPTTLKITATLRETANGKSGPKREFTQVLRKEDFTALTAAMALNPWWDFGPPVSWFASSGPRPFEKQPIGKIARGFAHDVSQQTIEQAPMLVPTGTAPNIVNAASEKCNIELRIRYTKRNVSSKAYTLLVNNRDETTSINGEGAAQLQLPSGEVVMQIELKDAPYKLPIQPWYQGSTLLDCKQPEKRLLLTVGPAGEGLLAWQP